MAAVNHNVENIWSYWCTVLCSISFLGFWGSRNPYLMLFVSYNFIVTSISKMAAHFQVVKFEFKLSLSYSLRKDDNVSY